MGSQIIVRDASVNDAEELVELDRAIHQDGRGVVLDLAQLRDPDAERRRIEEVQRDAAGGATRVLVATIEDRVAGSAELRQLGPALCRHVGVLAIGVHPEHQRRGIGRALMRTLLDHARARGLERVELYVRADNERAHALYRSLGFTHEGTRARFVRLPDGRYVDDWIFVLFLEGAGASP